MADIAKELDYFKEAQKMWESKAGQWLPPQPSYSYEPTVTYKGYPVFPNPYANTWGGNAADLGKW